MAGPHHRAHTHGHGHDAGPLREDLAHDSGRGKVLFIDAFSGVAGDMLVAALLDLGVPRSVIDNALAVLPLGGYRIELGSAVRSGIVARRFMVHVDERQPERDYAQIRAMLEAADLSAGTRAIALDAFRTLAQAEATVHRVPVDDVHFHEVGAVDSIVDIVASAAALDWLGATVIASPLPMGRGTVRARHGVLPLPAPATVECLRGAPTYDAGIDAELVTPTGACLVATCARTYARWPEMRPERVGWGGGTHELPDRPNLLRIVLGHGARETEEGSFSNAPFAILEANVDDMTAEVAAHAVERVLAAGALDVWTTPIVMKKGRPAMMISALVRRDDVDTSARLLLSETTSLGVRVRPVFRVERPRRMLEVQTPFGRIPVKVADGDGLPINLAPEFEACRAAANNHGVPVKEVVAAALVAVKTAFAVSEPKGTQQPSAK
jgi:uncharacterized protein (TIGR00299 family) protein